MLEFLFDAPLYDDDLLKLAVRLAHDLLFLGLVVQFGLKRNNGTNPEFAFTAVLLNLTVFFICFTLEKLDLGLERQTINCGQVCMLTGRNRQSVSY